MCFLRDLGGDAAEELLRRACRSGEHFIGVGLDSAEVGWPPRLFAKAYEMARAEGQHRVAHAGEEGGPDYVREALDVLGVERIDHGNRALEDPGLVARLRDERAAADRVPLSNVAPKGVPRIEDHPAAPDARARPGRHREQRRPGVLRRRHRRQPDRADDVARDD